MLTIVVAIVLASATGSTPSPATILDLAYAAPHSWDLCQPFTRLHVGMKSDADYVFRLNGTDDAFRMSLKTHKNTTLLLTLTLLTYHLTVLTRSDSQPPTNP